MTKASHRNTTFDELAVGQTARIERTVTANDLYVFAHASGNTNPIHMPGKDVDERRNSRHRGALAVGRLARLLGARHDPARRRHALPRPDLSVPRSRQARRPARRLGALHREARASRWRCSRPGSRKRTARCFSKASPKSTAPDDHDRPEGSAIADAAGRRARSFRRADRPLPRLPPMPTAVVCPDDENSLGGALLSRAEGLIAPIFIGSREQDPEGRRRGRRGHLRHRPHRYRRPLRGRGAGGRDGQRERSPRRHEGQRPFGRAAGAGGQAGRRLADIAPHQPRLRHGRADAAAACSSSPTRRSTSRPTSPPRSTSCRTRSSSRSPAASRCRRSACSPRSRP